MTEPVHTLNHLLLQALDKHAAQVCFHVKSARLLQNITYRQFRKWVFRLGWYLQNLPPTEQGHLPRLAIVARNSPEWMAAYVAGMMAGVLVVPIRSSLPLHQAELILAQTRANLIVGHERDVVLLLNYFQERLPHLTRALFIRNPDNPLLRDTSGDDDSPSEPPQHAPPHVETRDLYSILNRPLSAEQAQVVRNTAVALPGNRPASVFFSPASDGKLRGLAFSLEQGRLTLDSMAEWFPLDDDDLAYTPPHPLSDFAGLHAALLYLVHGVPNALATGRETSFEELQHFSPTVTLTNPYVFEYIYLKVMEEMGQMPRSSRQVFQWALTVGKDYHAAGLNASAELTESYRRADMTFFSNIRGMLGGRLHRLYSTSAPLSQQWLDFAGAIGLVPLNVYSSTRAGGFPAASLVDERVTGSCGQIAPGYQIRIADDGEILVRSRMVALGEWQTDGSLRPVVDSDGWLHTGDLGRFDSDGNLYLTGHKSAPLILATGRKVNPVPIEAQLMASPYIKQAMIYGEGRRYLSALIVPDFKAIAATLTHHQDANGPSDNNGANGIAHSVSDELDEVTGDDPKDNALDEIVETTAEGLPESGPDVPVNIGAASGPPGVPSLQTVSAFQKIGSKELSVKHPAVIDLIDQVVREVNVNLDDWEQIERFRLLKKLTRNGVGAKLSRGRERTVGLDAQTREEIAGAYTAEIEAMYPAAAPFAKKQLTQVKVDPEHLRHLVEKEGILEAWMNDAGIEFLLELARQKQIDAPSMVNIAETIGTISQMQNELRPLSTAFLVGNPSRIARALPESALQLRQYDHIRRMRRIVISLAKIVDGQVMAYAIDKYGFLRGIHRLDVEMDTTGSDLTGAHYRLMAAISRRCDTVVFSIPRGGKQVRVFSDGRLVGRYVSGSWLPESKSSIDQVMARLAERKEYDLPLLRRLIRCAFRMSEQNLGAIFLLGDASMILARSDDSEIQNVANIVNMPVSELSDEELIAFAKEDGATVVDENGELRGCMVLLRPAADTQAQIGPGKGARHSSAAKMSAETDCIAITISQDGPITIYDGGQRVLAL